MPPRPEPCGSGRFISGTRTALRAASLIEVTGVLEDVVVEPVAGPFPERDGGRAAPVHERIDAASAPGQEPALNLPDQRHGDALAAHLRISGQARYVGAPAVPAADDGPDGPSSRLRDEEEIRGEGVKRLQVFAAVRQAGVAIDGRP